METLIQQLGNGGCVPERAVVSWTRSVRGRLCEGVRAARVCVCVWHNLEKKCWSAVSLNRRISGSRLHQCIQLRRRDFLSLAALCSRCGLQQAPRRRPSRVCGTGRWRRVRANFSMRCSETWSLSVFRLGVGFVENFPYRSMKTRDWTLSMNFFRAIADIICVFCSRLWSPPRRVCVPADVDLSTTRKQYRLSGRICKTKILHYSHNHVCSLGVPDCRRS